jgi:nucleotide-binding universal stress UspA family protein
MNTVNGFKKIILATDGSRQADTAVGAAIAMALPSAAVVQVVHVWNMEIHERDGRWDVEGRKEATKLVHETIRRVQAGGVSTEGRLVHAGSDRLAASICEAARQFDADLVVLGSRGLSDWGSMLKHSVSHQVLSALDCPVLVVRGGPAGDARGPKRVVLAIAGGQDVPTGVRAAIAAARAPGSRVLVVHVAQATFFPQGDVYIESDEEIQATMAGAISRLDAAGIKAEAMVAHTGPVARSIAEIAAGWDADLIVVGSSRMGDVGSLLLGSVSHHLLHEANRPVLIAERVKS